MSSSFSVGSKYSTPLQRSAQPNRHSMKFVGIRLKTHVTSFLTIAHWYRWTLRFFEKLSILSSVTACCIGTKRELGAVVEFDGVEEHLPVRHF